MANDMLCTIKEEPSFDEVSFKITDGLYKERYEGSEYHNYCSRVLRLGLAPHLEMDKIASKVKLSQKTKGTLPTVWRPWASRKRKTLCFVRGKPMFRKGEDRLHHFKSIHGRDIIKYFEPKADKSERTLQADGILRYLLGLYEQLCDWGYRVENYDYVVRSHQRKARDFVEWDLSRGNVVYWRDRPPFFFFDHIPEHDVKFETYDSEKFSFTRKVTVIGQDAYVRARITAQDLVSSLIQPSEIYHPCSSRKEGTKN